MSDLIILKLLPQIIFIWEICQNQPFLQTSCDFSELVFSNKNKHSHTPNHQKNPQELCF